MPRHLFLCLLLAVCLAQAAGAAPKTDILVMDNGDRITCEILNLERGKLSAKTDDMGTLSIKWLKIARLESQYLFLVTTRDGTLVFGQLLPTGADDALRVVHLERDTILDMGEVVGIKAIKYSLLDKVDFSIDMGVSSYKATGMSQFTTDARFAVNGRIHRGSARYSALYAKDKDDEVTRRHDLNLVYDRLVTGKFSGYLNTGLERNEELGLKARVLGGGGVGYRILEGLSHRLDASLGVSRTREWATSGDLVESSTEGLIRTSLSIYLYDSPKTTLDITLAVMPAIDGKDRVRTQSDASVKQEIFSDFFLGLNYFERYDSAPPPGADSNSDRGLTFTVGWSK